MGGQVNRTLLKQPGTLTLVFNNVWVFARQGQAQAHHRALGTRA